MMTGPQVLFVAGTHGNEINAPWLFSQWLKQPNLINNNGLRVSKIIGNPEALKDCKRYLQCDLNRSFREELLNAEKNNSYEVMRAKELLSIYGPSGSNACQIAIDLHSTTSSMGCCLVVYGRRPVDLAIASLLQARIGWPIYLHEGDITQQGFMVESWPCGFVIEIGPVPQGMLHSRIINQTRLAINICLEEVAKLKIKKASFPRKIVVHRHIKSIDFPRSDNGEIDAFVHPSRQSADWKSIKNGSPLFMKADGNVITYKGNENLVPVFINEAAYAEKNIAMSLTSREVWNVSDNWKKSIYDLFLENY